MFKIKVLLVTVAVAFSVTAWSMPPTAVKKVFSENPVAVNAAAIELRTKLKALPMFSAIFSQQVFDAKNKLIQQASGDLSVKQPNQFRWVTNEPDESLIVSNGQSVWIYNPFVEQVSIMSLDDTVKQSPLWLIANQTDKAWEQFDVTRQDNTFSITPKNLQALTRQIDMTFVGDSLSELTLKDSQGQSSVFSLTKFDQQATFQPNTFTFVVPEGVDVDDQRDSK